MFQYNICTEPDEALFQQQCKALETNVPGLEIKQTLHDVDGSTTKIYTKDGLNIAVHNSLYVGALYIDSELELTQFFQH